MDNKTFNVHRHKYVGPGGLGCPCCTNGPANVHKRIVKRRVRRKLKMEVKKNER